MPRSHRPQRNWLVLVASFVLGTQVANAQTPWVFFPTDDVLIRDGDPADENGSPLILDYSFISSANGVSTQNSRVIVDFIDSVTTFVTNTSSTVAAGGGWTLGSSSPFATGTATFGADNLSIDPGPSARIEVTVELSGFFTELDATGAPDPSISPTSPATIDHAQLSLTSSLFVTPPGSTGGAELEELDPVVTDLVENTTITDPLGVTFFMQSKTLLPVGAAIESVRGQMDFELGPNDAAVIPVSAEIMLRIVPEPGTLSLVSIGACLFGARRWRRERSA